MGSPSSSVLIFPTPLRGKAELLRVYGIAAFCIDAIPGMSMNSYRGRRSERTTRTFGGEKGSGPRLPLLTPCPERKLLLSGRDPHPGKLTPSKRNAEDACNEEAQRIRPGKLCPTPGKGRGQGHFQHPKEVLRGAIRDNRGDAQCDDDTPAR